MTEFRSLRDRLIFQKFVKMDGREPDKESLKELCDFASYRKYLQHIIVWLSWRSSNNVSHKINLRLSTMLIQLMPLTEENLVKYFINARKNLKMKASYLWPVGSAIDWWLRVVGSPKRMKKNFPSVSEFSKKCGKHDDVKQSATFTKRQLEKYWKTTRREGKSLTIGVISIVGLFGCLRQGEIYQLKWEM